MGEETVKIVVEDKVGVDFFKAVMVLHRFKNEVALTINLAGILSYYMARAGIPPLTNLWEEIRALIMWCVNRAKAERKDNVPFVIRLHGGGIPMWLVLKIYAAVVYECDGVYVLGDICIKI